ncbi:hypothetical protein WOC76_04815 [Methylocystis sp. IM3]
MPYIVFYADRLSSETLDHVTLGYPTNSMLLMSDYFGQQLSSFVGWLLNGRDYRFAAYKVQTSTHVDQLKLAAEPAFVIEDDQEVLQNLTNWSSYLARLGELITSADMLSDYLPLHRNWMNADTNSGSQIQPSDRTDHILAKLRTDEANLRTEIEDYIRSIHHWPPLS